jgi:hypothetical protein
MRFRLFLSLVLYGFEMWSFTLRGEYRLGMNESRVLRILGPKTEVARWWRKLNN